MRDEGAGLSPEMLAHGAERFVRSRASGGAGLGLAIVAEIARSHGGRTGVRNLDPGAEAWISVPRVVAGAQVSDAAPPAAAPLSSRRG